MCQYLYCNILTIVHSNAIFRELLKTSTSNFEENPVKEDIWIKSTCSMCFSQCAIKVHRVDGVVVKIEGNPECPTLKRTGLLRPVYFFQ